MDSIKVFFQNDTVTKALSLFIFVLAVLYVVSLAKKAS